MKRSQVRRSWAALCGALLLAGPVFAQSFQGSGAPADGAPLRNPVDRQAAQALAAPAKEAAAKKALPANNAALGSINVAIGEIPVGKSLSIFFDVTVNSPFPAAVTEVSNQGTVSGSNFSDVLTDDPDDATSNADPTVTPVIAMPAFSVATKTVSDAVTGNNDGLAQPGELLQYEVTLVNSGNGGDSNVNVVDAVPTGTTLALGSVAGVLTNGASGFTDSSAGNTLDVTVASMPGGGSQAVISFQVTVDAPVPAGVELLSNLAQVAGDFTAQFDTNPADIVVDAIPVFILDKDDGGVSVDPETTVVYTLTYSNTGDQDASNVVLEDTVPVGTTFDAAASSAGWSCFTGDPEGTLCTISIGTVAGGGSASVDFAAEVVAPQNAPVVISNSATVRDDGAGSGGAPVEASDSDSTPVNDLLPPTVVNVDTIKTNGDGVLEECESVGNNVSAFRVTFSEGMDEASIVDTANWLVVAAGPDFDLATDFCGPLAGDDVAVAVSSIDYDTLELRAHLNLDTDPFLEDGPYRLLACATGAITDAAGNELDGDGDFNGGDDFARTFRVDAIDAFANGHFDCDLDPWLAVTSGGSTVLHEPLMDMDNATISGSAHATNEAGSLELALGQCVDVGGGAIHDFTGFVFLDTPGTTIDVIRTCEFFLDLGCAGNSLPAQAFIDTLAVDGVWTGFEGVVPIPELVRSTLCQVTLRTATGAAYEAFLDDLSFDLLQSPIIFEDGFESGDFLEWSQVVFGN